VRLIRGLLRGAAALSQRKKSMNIELKVRIDPKLIAKIITLIAVIFA
jgi:hypothetical protein